MSFPRYPKYKDSGVEWLGEVPEHWEVSGLKHLLQTHSTMASEKSGLDDERIPLSYTDRWMTRRWTARREQILARSSE